MAFSPDEKTLALAIYSSTIELWDAGAGQRIRSLKDHDESVSSVAFSPDGKTLASGSHDGTIKIMGNQLGNLLATLMRFKDGNWITFIPGDITSLQRMSRCTSPGARAITDSMRTESPGTEFMSRFNKPDLVVAGLRGEKVAVITSSGTARGEPPRYLRQHYGYQEVCQASGHD